MKKKLLFTLSFLCFITICFAQNNTAFEKWKPLMGKWKGEGGGKPGDGGGIFSFRPDLDQKIIVCKSHSEYATQNNGPKTIHDDVMIIYSDNDGNASKAIYFDSEGHTIHYNITYTDKEIILTSEKIKGFPVYRLTYSLLEKNNINTKFEMSRDGVTFMTFVEGKSKKIK